MKIRSILFACFFSMLFFVTSRSSDTNLASINPNSPDFQKTDPQRTLRKWETVVLVKNDQSNLESMLPAAQTLLQVKQIVRSKSDSNLELYKSKQVDVKPHSDSR